jgi:hypothetical protein
MKVVVINRSNKKRSKASIDELKQFTVNVAAELGINKKIDIVRLIYHTDFYNYYPKGKPLFGFYILYHDRIATIYLAKHWDASQNARKTSIIHELTHAKQMIEKRLVIGRNFNSAKWNGETNYSWKKFSFKKYESLSGRSQDIYIRELLPWENEVRYNTESYLKNKFFKKEQL